MPNSVAPEYTSITVGAATGEAPTLMSPRASLSPSQGKATNSTCALQERRGGCAPHRMRGVILRATSSPMRGYAVAVCDVRNVRAGLFGGAANPTDLSCGRWRNLVPGVNAGPNTACGAQRPRMAVRSFTADGVRRPGAAPAGRAGSLPGLARPSGWAHNGGRGRFLRTSLGGAKRCDATWQRRRSWRPWRRWAG